MNAPAKAATAAQPWRHAMLVGLRVCLAAVAGYLLTGMGCAVMAQALVLAGLFSPAHAVLLSTLLGFVLYTALLLWAFHVQQLARLALQFAAAALLLASLRALLECWL